MLTLLSMVFKEDEDSKLFPKIIKSGFISPKTPYLVLKTEFSGTPGPGGTLTSKVGSCSIGDKITKLESQFDEVTIAIIGLQIVSLD